MKRNQKTLLIALLIPFFGLTLLTGYKKYLLTVGKEVILPIEGYDPRDLLSGHYLIYQVKYGLKKTCPKSSSKERRKAYICLDKENRFFHFKRPSSSRCSLFIKGECHHGRFKAGIERFFIPQAQSSKLDKLVRGGKGSLVLSVTAEGHASIKNLLIEGKAWSK